MGTPPRNCESAPISHHPHISSLKDWYQLPLSLETLLQETLSMARRDRVERLFRKLEDRALILRAHFDRCEATHGEIDPAKTQFQHSSSFPTAVVKIFRGLHPERRVQILVRPL